MAKHIRTLLVVCVLFAMICGITGAYAGWKYTSESADEITEVVHIGVGEFTWAGSEDLPDSVEGEDHAWLITNLVGGTNASGTEIGLNNPDSALNTYIQDRLEGGWNWERDYFGSMAVTGGSDVEDLFGTEAAGLSFLIEVESDTEYYIYTTSVYLGERGEVNFWGNNKTAGSPTVPIGEYIYPIYRTRLTRTSSSADWEIVETKCGKAKSDWYDENRSNANATQIPCFDKDSWVEAQMGKSMSDAIWTFVGDDPTAYATQSAPTVYYKLKSTTARTITVTSNSDCVIKIYASGGNELAESVPTQNADGSVTERMSCAISANTVYYISVTGSDVMDFAIN